MHKKPKVCGFFAERGSGPTLLGMPDIQTLGVITIDNKTIGRQLTLGYNADKTEKLPV